MVTGGAGLPAATEGSGEKSVTTLPVAPEHQDACLPDAVLAGDVGVGWGGGGPLGPQRLPGQGAIRPSQVNNISVSRGESTCSVSSGSQMCLARRHHLLGDSVPVWLLCFVPGKYDAEGEAEGEPAAPDPPQARPVLPQQGAQPP